MLVSMRGGSLSLPNASEEETFDYVCSWFFFFSLYNLTCKKLIEKSHLSYVIHTHEGRRAPRRNKEKVAEVS